MVLHGGEWVLTAEPGPSKWTEQGRSRAARWHPTGNDVANLLMPGRKWHNVERLGDFESHWTSADVNFNPEGKENRGLIC